jgi:hypothetical protein
MLALSLFGYAHLRRTTPETEILPGIATRAHAHAHA